MLRSKKRTGDKIEDAGEKRRRREKKVREQGKEWKGEGKRRRGAGEKKGRSRGLDEERARKSRVKG